MGLLSSKSSSSTTNVFDETAQQLTATDEGVALAVSRGGVVNLTDQGATRAALDAVNSAATDAFEFGAGSLEATLGFVGSATDGLFNTVQSQIASSFNQNANILEFTAGAIENNTTAIGNAYSEALEASILFAGQAQSESLDKVDEALNFVDGTVTSVLAKS